MEILQVIVLILGAILFTVSFFIPDKKVSTKEVREKEERIFRELMEKELPDIQKRIEEATEEGIERAKENTQRQMERLTNEKMMAINEYSDTVMNEIHKNHEEAVFLYDMLNNKHAQVKNTAAELTQVMKQTKQVQNVTKNSKSKDDRKTPVAAPVSGSDMNIAAETVGNAAEAAQESSVTEETTFEPMASKELEVIIAPKQPESNSKQKDKARGESNQNTGRANNVEIMFATEGNEENSNDRILELHKAGKSNMAIARELGLGIGEVKLVIDLFKGGL